MIIQLVLAIAAAVSPTAVCYSMNPAHQYFDVIGSIDNEQDFVTIEPEPRATTIDAQIIGKEKAPPLPQTNNPLKLLGLTVAANFDAIRRAYKEKVKIYHPDVVVGPEASDDERKKANWDFARINSAYDILKRKEHEETYEYEMYVDGQQVKRTVYVNKDPRQNKRDAHYVDYDRIRQVAEYRKTHPRKKMWYEEDHEYQQMNNGFEKDASYCSSQKWYNHLEMFEYEPEMGGFPYNEFISTQERMRRNGFGFGAGHHYEQAEEKFWHNRHTFERGNRWWNEDDSPYTRFSGMEDNSYDTYNDRWYRTVAEHDFGPSNNHGDYGEFDRYDPTETWYKHFDDEPKFNGHFGP